MVSWDFGDGTKAQNAVTRHRYAKPGDYTVTVEARDSTGLACGVATDSATVHALARPNGRAACAFRFGRSFSSSRR